MRRRTRYQDPKLIEENGQYKVRYRDIERRKRTKCFGKAGEVTLAEAKRAKNKFIEHLNDEIVQGLKRDRTLSDLVELWKETELDTIGKPATQKNYLWALGKLGDLMEAPLAVLSKPDFKAWLLSLDMKPQSLAKVRSCIVVVLESAVDWGWIKTNPLRGRMKLPKPEPTEKIVLSFEQVGKLYPLLDIEARAAFLLGVLTGLRCGEMMALEWADVEPPWVRVTKTVNFQGRIDTPKTKKSKRRVEQGKLLQAILEQWKRVGQTDSPLVFPPRTAQRFRSFEAILRSQIAPIAKRLGLPPLTWHTLRHTYNTWGHLAGVDRTVMRDAMGHASVTTNEDIYSHVRQLRPTGAAAKIESLLEPQSGTPELEAIDTKDFPVQ